MVKKRKFKEEDSEIVFDDVSNSYSSFVWKHFKRNKNEEKAKCDHCHRIMINNGGATTSLRNHLRIKHDIHVENTSSISAFHF